MAVPVSSHRKKASELVSKQSGFSLHAGVACKSNQHKRLERPGGVPLCRYISRPAIALEIEKCENCGGKMKIIACIEDPDVIEKILKHLGLDEALQARK